MGDARTRKGVSPTFSHLARVAAVLALLVGALELLAGVGIATGHIDRETREAAGVSTAPGRLIDRGIERLLLAVALGTLAEIGLSLARRADVGD